MPFLFQNILTFEQGISEGGTNMEKPNKNWDVACGIMTIKDSGKTGHPA